MKSRRRFSRFWMVLNVSLRLATYCRLKPPRVTVFFFEEDLAELQLQVRRDVVGLFHHPQILVELAGRFVQRGVLLWACLGVSSALCL